MKSRKMIIAVLLFAAVAVSGATFAYWANTVADDDSTVTGDVKIGEGDNVTTTIAVDDQTDGGTLVPVGFEDGDDVNNVDLTFPVTWESDNPSDADPFTGDLSVTVGDIFVDGEDKSDLFTVTVTSGEGEITEDESQNVVVNVEFTNEPEDADEYGDVQNNTVDIELTFSVDNDFNE